MKDGCWSLTGQRRAAEHLNLLPVWTHRALPSSLLLLSRAFTVTQPVAGRPAEVDLQMESLKDTLGALNKEVVEEVGYEVGDIGCVAVQPSRIDKVAQLTNPARGWFKYHLP